MKITDGSSKEEMDMEQMMVKSMANIQLEQAKKYFKDIPLNTNSVVQNFIFPEIFKCFGFKVNDYDISYKKS